MCDEEIGILPENKPLLGLQADQTIKIFQRQKAAIRQLKMVAAPVIAKRPGAPFLTGTPGFVDVVELGDEPVSVPPPLLTTVPPR
jgi:hypothetical protein